MTRPVTLRQIALAFCILAPAPAVALLCRGRTPSRFDTPNLPVWERKPPAPAPAPAVFLLPPLLPGMVRYPNNPWLRTLQSAHENTLVTGRAGVWLAQTCAWGRASSALGAKQDRVANRLMAAQNRQGLFERPGQSASEKAKALSSKELSAQRDCLRGLLAYYAVSRRPAALYAALAAGEPLVDARSTASAALLTRLSQQTGSVRFLNAACQRVSAGDAWGLCALYEATGKASYLSAARAAWTRGSKSADLAAELLLLTGQPEYAQALNTLPDTGTGQARAGWTRAPQGMAINTDRDSAATFHQVRLSQKTTGQTRSVAASMPMPTAFRLRVLLPPGHKTQVAVNGVPSTAPTPPGGYVVLLRRWRNGDVITFLPARTPDTAPAPR